MISSGPKIWSMHFKQVHFFVLKGIKNKHAFLDLLLLAELDGKKMDDESVREEVDTFMFEVSY